MYYFVLALSGLGGENDVSKVKYLILPLNKIIQCITLCLLYQAWGAKTTCRKWKGDDGRKRL